jgi:basic membrane lipoprotein Med (substrate-binding protein (PBP1-ABC) superfamily)
MMAKWLVLTLIMLLTAAHGSAGGAPEPLKVGFIYVGPVGDYGWSYAHDQGRKFLETTVPDVKTTYVESVPEGADAERVLTQLARSGHDEWWPIGTGIVGLSPFGPAVSDAIKSLVEQRKQDLSAGRFDVFWGPIKDQSGKVRIAAGEKPADVVLLGIDWFVEGAVGTVPK